MLKQIIESVESVLCDLFDWPTRQTCEALDRMGCAENLKLGRIFYMKYMEISYEKFIFTCNGHSCGPFNRPPDAWCPEWNAYLNSLGCVVRQSYKVFQVSRKDFIVSNPPGGFIVVPEETASKILAIGLP